jgi:hypothetical protein
MLAASILFPQIILLKIFVKDFWMCKLIKNLPHSIPFISTCIFWFCEDRNRSNDTKNRQKSPVKICNWRWVAFSDDRIWFHFPAGCEIWRNFQHHCSSPARMCHVTPHACAQERQLGWDGVLLPFDFTKEEIGKICLNEGSDSCFGCSIPVQQLQRKRQWSIRLEMYPVWPILGSFSTFSSHIFLLVKTS